MRALRNSLKQLSNMVSKPEAQNDIQGTFAPRDVPNQKAGFLHRIIAAVKEKLASVCQSVDSRRNTFYFRFNEGKRRIVRHGEQSNAGRAGQAKQN